MPLREALLTTVHSNLGELPALPVDAPLIAMRFVGLCKLDLMLPPRDAEDIWRAVGQTLEVVSIGREEEGRNPSYRATLQHINLITGIFGLISRYRRS